MRATVSQKQLFWNSHGLVVFLLGVLTALVCTPQAQKASWEKYGSSDMAYNLFGNIIGKVTGTPYDDYVERKVRVPGKQASLNGQISEEQPLRHLYREEPLALPATRANTSSVLALYNKWNVGFMSEARGGKAPAEQRKFSSSQVVPPAGAIPVSVALDALPHMPLNLYLHLH